MPTFEDLYKQLLNNMNNQSDEEFRIEFLATFASPNLGEGTKALLEQNEAEMRVLPDLIEKSIFDYKILSSVEQEQQEEVEDGPSTESNNVTYSNITSGY